MAIAKRKPAEPVRIDLKKEDTVKVISGRDKGKTGRVLQVDRGDGQGAGGARDDDQASHAPEPGQADQGRHRGAREPDPGVERDDRVPGLQQGGARGASRRHGGRRQDPPHASLPQVRADARQEISEDFMAARLREHYQKKVVPALTKEFGYKNVDGGAEDREDLDQHRAGRSHAERQADGRRGQRTDADRRPEAGDHEGDEIDRAVQAARGPVDRLHGDAARRPHVRIFRPAGERGAAARPRFPRRFDARASTAAAITRWASRIS